MPQNPPYLPTRKASLRAWATNFSSKLTLTPALFGLLPADAVIVSTATNLWIAAYDVTQSPSTKTAASVAAADQLQADYLGIVRPVATRISANDGVTDASKTSIGVTVRSELRSPVSAPGFAPQLELDGVSHGSARLRYLNVETPDSKAAPLGCAGVQVGIHYGVSAASSPGKADEVCRKTKSPFALNTQAYSGLICTVFTRWETARGHQGQTQYSPWSAPVSFPVVG
jgi:hypothetical protein